MDLQAKVVVCVARLKGYDWTDKIKGCCVLPG